ncbi:hypothetical protein, partial [Gemmiger formicilis]|uniref:hypothetical protein n=1 Tax=Gemmiger formicilis TaxID=745368 RepID=UPI0030777010
MYKKAAGIIVSGLFIQASSLPSWGSPACQKIAFLSYCVCRGDHWSPANLPQQRIFRESFFQGKQARASNARPYNALFRQFELSSHLLHLFQLYLPLIDHQ